MAFVRIATVDDVNGEVIREALHDAEIAVNLVPVRPFRQIEYLRHQHRARLDVMVEPEREEDARRILSQLEHEAAEAVEAQAHADPFAEKSLDDLRLEQRERLALVERERPEREDERDRRGPAVLALLVLSVLVGLWLYASGRRQAVHGRSSIQHLWPRPAEAEGGGR